MDLNKLQTLLEANPTQMQDVDWDFKSVTIITNAGNTKKRKKSDDFEDESDTEVIDPENIESDGEGDLPVDGGGEGDGEGGGDGDDTSTEIKIGSIIQDFKTGQYGKVTNIHPNGDVDWVPVSEEELRSGGFIASMKLDRSNLNGFIG